MAKYNLGVFCIANSADSFNERIARGGSNEWVEMQKAWFMEHWNMCIRLGFIDRSMKFDPDQKFVRVWVHGQPGDEWMDRCEQLAKRGDFNLSDHGISDKFRDELGLYQREGTHHNPFLYYLPEFVALAYHEGDTKISVVNGVELHFTFSQKGRRGSQWGDWDENVRIALKKVA